MAVCNGRTVCDYCGEDMGDKSLHYPREIDSCGERECARDDERARDDAAREEAEADDYGRYRY